MQNYKFKVSSITNAQRGQRLLSSNGISSKIEKIQNPQNGDGCGYTIAVKGNKDYIQKILSDAGIRIIGVDIV